MGYRISSTLIMALSIVSDVAAPLSMQHPQIVEHMTVYDRTGGETASVVVLKIGRSPRKRCTKTTTRQPSDRTSQKVIKASKTFLREMRTEFVF